MFNDVFVIADIGANHGGDPKLCEAMIIQAARCGVDAVKLQTRSVDDMFTQEALAQPYHNENSHGRTYREHRKALDWFGIEEYRYFKEVAEDHGVLFCSTPFEEKSAKMLNKVGMPLWKTASCDARNIPFLKLIAGYGQPMVISTGGASYEDVERIVDAVKPINPDFALLHCVSRYPNDDDLQLAAIWKMRIRFAKPVGFSSHHPGIMPLIIAKVYGATVFEVHFTLNRGSRGTDHGFSMEPRGLETLCNDLRRVTPMIGTGKKESSHEGFVAKMGKGVYLRQSLPKGYFLSESDLICLAPYAGGFEPYQIEEIIGRSLITDLSTGVNVGVGHVR